MVYALNEEAVHHIQKEYTRSDLPWFVGYSGGKDSSAVLTLVFHALLNLSISSKPITILYCDTGVEIPIVRAFVIETFQGITKEAQTLGLPIQTQVVMPPLQDRYFVKVIGRGYPPPTNKFRWCTDRLRIKPVKQILKSIPSDKHIVLLGIRRGESQERDKTIRRHETEKRHFFRQGSNENTLIYSPIADYTVEEVWATLVFNPIPESIDGKRLLALYKQADGECPVIRDSKGIPCGKGRFGCWTCTVVRRDRAVEGLVSEGHLELEPLLGFRNWLSTMRDEPCNRCKKRRNGQSGPGPLTLAAREEILSKLLNAQEHSGLALINDQELGLIEQLWERDRSSSTYTEI